MLRCASTASGEFLKLDEKVAQDAVTVELMDNGLIFAAALFISVIPMTVMTLLQRFYATSVASTGGKE
ncbi:hypothetical protein CN311_06555 [Mesorhizobium sanjuanii]|uniref:Uncharacterized protein n=1 Tax=Mesorhizobium sanjuanii TaxID=2037900 RepID=A0A2A6FK93_9HYPH|nr:hypothetical protein CN311_06555 [Mesorhizobium sanjuanii]